MAPRKAPTKANEDGTSEKVDQSVTPDKEDHFVFGDDQKILFTIRSMLDENPDNGDKRLIAALTKLFDTRPLDAFRLLNATFLAAVTNHENEKVQQTAARLVIGLADIAPRYLDANMIPSRRVEPDDVLYLLPKEERRRPGYILWTQRKNDPLTAMASIPEFILRVYGYRLRRGFTQADLKAADRSLYLALHQWLKTNKLPFDLPTQREWNDHQMRLLGLDPHSKGRVGSIDESMRLHHALRQRQLRARQKPKPKPQ